MKMSPVVHFEMPAEDKKWMSDFYARVFGWHTQQLGPEMGNYVLVHTTETTEDGMVQAPGRINGGFTEKSKENPSTTFGMKCEGSRRHAAGLHTSVFRT